jgi:feruloyl-CoA synthase
MDLRVRRDDDGSIWLAHGQPLEPFDGLFITHIERQARAQPTKTAYARRGPGGAVAGAAWREVSYAELHDRVRRIAGWFAAREARGQVLLLLTGNSIEHAVLRLGAIAAGVIVCPVSAGYIAAGGDFARLAYVRDLVRPRYVFAESAGSLGAAAALFDAGAHTLLCADAALPGDLPLPAHSLAELETGAPLEGDGGGDPEAPAAYMLTSGSTGRPKAVVQSQRMILANLHQARQVLGRAAGWSEYMLDWLPWSHVSGAFNLYAAAVFGGSLYIDDGKPVAGLFDETVANLREMALPYFCNVPLGYGWLVDALRDDAALRRTFFSKLRLMLYGGAGLSQPVMDALQNMAVEETGCRVMMTTGYGLTESASGCMAIYFPTDRVGIGLPMPGLETRLVPLERDRYEIRLRGPNVMTGYLDNPEATAAAFDAEGCFRTGDAARFHEPDDPAQGLAYAGRLVEEFKLSSGTWVRSGAVRAELIAALSPAVGDVLLCGLNEDYLAALLVPSPAGLRSVSGEDSEDLSALCAHPAVRAFLAEKLAAYNARYPGNSTAVARVAFMRRLPDPQRHEISDKGTINQRIAADNRDDEIAALYADEPAEHVVSVSGG